MQDPALWEVTGIGWRNKGRVTGSTCLSIHSHPSLPYIQQDSSWIGHCRSWRDEETMLWMTQLHSCHTTLFSPWPLLIPQGHLTVEVVAPKQLTAPPFPSSPVAPCKIALRIRWCPEDNFAGSHGLDFAPYPVSWSSLSQTKGSRRCPNGKAFQENF